ncbi:hypothetical protein ACNSOL_11575 (plasmid) [Aliarcobacter lanthieri]|uniref:hypothetical protein n=1 Tax=Aliarcobacter lanthieri TaxID=1355374 RepID=UPI003AADFC88
MSHRYLLDKFLKVYSFTLSSLFEISNVFKLPIVLLSILSNSTLSVILFLNCSSCKIIFSIPK